MTNLREHYSTKAKGKYMRGYIGRNGLTPICLIFSLIPIFFPSVSGGESVTGWPCALSKASAPFWWARSFDSPKIPSTCCVTSPAVFSVPLASTMRGSFSLGCCCKVLFVPGTEISGTAVSSGPTGRPPAVMNSSSGADRSTLSSSSSVGAIFWARWIAPLERISTPMTEISENSFRTSELVRMIERRVRRCRTATRKV